jgi:diguanylate cyclase (GGDEF)-like protein
MQVQRKLKIGFIVTFAVMMVTAIVPFGTAHWAHALQSQLRAAQAKIEHLTNALSCMQDAETGERGFLITGLEEFLDPYHDALVRLRQVRVDLHDDALAEPAWAPQLQRLDQLIGAELAELDRTIALRRAQGFAAVQPVVATASAKQTMDRIRGSVAELTVEENRRRTTLRDELEYRTDVDAWVGLAATLIDMALLAALLVVMTRLSREQRRASQALQRSTEELNASLAALEQRGAEISLVGQMTRALESPMSMTEAFETLSTFCAKLLPTSSGMLYLFRNSRDLLEREARWGAPLAAVDVIGPHDCWALRRGQPHRTLTASDLACPHYRDAGALPQGALCIPLVAQGEVLGLACIQPNEGGALPAAAEALANMVCEQISLTLSNIRLREALRQQSIVDPLTGLYNRRYMDETLRRELTRAVRKGAPLSLIVFDIDHFKKINDLFGHDGGDAVLRSLAVQLRRDVRESDVACRFGGEEFVLILTECDRATALARALKIAEEVRQLDVRCGSQPVGRITASFGVATFPEDGDSGETLFKAADQAVYSAKSRGRDRVVVAGEAP